MANGLTKKVTNRWDQLAADLEANALVFREIRAALEKPVLNNKVDLSKGMNLNAHRHLQLIRALDIARSGQLRFSD